MFPLCFLLDGTAVENLMHITPDLGVPRMNDFITFAFPDKVQHYRVQAVQWAYGMSIYPSVTIHLRRLRPAEWGNLGEPTGYTYVEARP